MIHRMDRLVSQLPITAPLGKKAPRRRREALLHRVPIGSTAATRQLRARCGPSPGIRCLRRRLNGRQTRCMPDTGRAMQTT